MGTPIYHLQQEGIAIHAGLLDDYSEKHQVIN
jgi:hypothetical protein